MNQPNPATTATVDELEAAVEGAARLRSCYGEEKYRRLVALKDRWDPDNLLRLNQNIEPNGRPTA